MKENLPKIYLDFIEECKSKDYSELFTHKHHIIPKFMGGDDSDDNLIVLSVEDHFLAHKILAENCDNNYKAGATGALNLLHKYWINAFGGDYSEIKRLLTNGFSGDKNGMYGKSHSEKTINILREKNIGTKNPFYGCTHTDKTKKDLSEKHKKWLSENGSPFKGKTHTEDMKRYISNRTLLQISEKGHPSNRKCIDLSTGKLYNSVKEMAMDLNIPKSTMCRWVRDDKHINFKYISYE